MYFTGQAGPKRKVDLRGRSRQEESREQILEKSRLERERRQRAKLEQKSALIIQTRYRQARTARQYADQLRNEWIHAYEAQEGAGEASAAVEQCLARDPKCVCILLRFYDQSNEGDRRRLALVCRAISSTAAAGTCLLLSNAAAGATSSDAASQAPSSATAAPSEQQLALFRVNKLAALCLTTLSRFSAQAAAELSSPMQPLTASQQPAAAMLDFLIKIANPDAWKTSIANNPQQQQQQAGQAAAAATAGAAAVLRHLYHQQLYSHLRVLLQAVPAALPGKSSVEVLVTQMTVRAITLQLIPTRTRPKTAATAAQAGSAATAPAGSAGVTAVASGASAITASETIRYGVSQLLFVAGLWSKCSSLAPVSGRLCTLALSEVCQQPSSRQLLAALPQNTTAAAGGNAPSSSSGLADAAAAISAWVDNLLGASASGVLLKGVDGEQSLAGQTVSALVLVLEADRLLAVLQKRTLKQQQQQQQRKGLQAAAAGQAAAGQGRPRLDPAAAAFVPGAGFVGGQAMELDDSSSEDADDMEVEQLSSAAAVEGPAVVGVEAEAGDGSIAAAAGAPAAKASKAAKAPVAASAYSAEQSAGTQQQGSSSSCLQLLAGTSKGTQLLRKLVALLLPATTAEDAAAAATAAAAPGSIAQQQLCALLWKLSRPKQYRQRIWLGLSVGVWLVPRLWYSYILPLHLATPGGFLALSSSSSSSQGGSGSSGGGSSGGAVPASAAAGAGGWVQPLLVLAQSYSAALSFTHLEDFYADAAPLVPLQQLYDRGNPAAGLVMLFKAAVWQVLWCETSAPGHSQQQQQRQQQLNKRALGEVGGLLLCKLHDRNCTRPYCPPEAFLADSLPPGRLLQEVAARGGIDALVGARESDDEETDHATPWEQQQQWQRQRQGISGVAAGAGVGGTEGDEQGGNGQQAGGVAGRGAVAAGAAAGRGAAAAAGSESESEEGEDDMGMMGGNAGGSGAAYGTGQRQPGVVLSSGFGFGAGGTVQQRRQQLGLGSGQGGGAGSAAAGGGGAGGSAGAGSRVWLVLQHAPCLIPFQDRVKLFQAVVSAEKEAAAAAADAAAAAGAGGAFTFDDPMEFLLGAHQNRFVTIRRDQLLQDSFTQLNAMGPDRLKGRLRIAYVNEAGAPEAGIDGGGLFKDFMEELLRKGFSPQSNLFAENPQHQLYPNPYAYQLVADADGQLQFLGRMLGKSLYEGMLLELPLAAFFLKKMRGGVCDINDLPSLDPEVYKNLLQLRHYKGDFADLSLTFTATVVDPAAAGSSSSSSSREVELKPGGRDVIVQPDNVIEYIHRLADFRLNRQMDRAAAAFLRGFFELIKPRWVRMFNEAELQMLISGSEEGIDVDDLVEHVNYAGGYHEEHPVILTLWDTVRTFSPQQQRQFLKFVTSCSRAPLLGFAYLEPQLCVQMSGSVLSPDSRERLPTAATCMNLLKLPPYASFDEMRAKLLYAITAGAGFELS